MKASKFSDAQKAYIVKRGEEGAPVAEICREAGISQGTYFNWKKKYAGLMLAGLSETTRLVQMCDSNVIHAHISAAGAKGGKRVRRLDGRGAGSVRKSI